MPHDLKHVETIFSAALEKSDAERDAFLNAECGGDFALRQRLDALLRSNDEASSASRGALPLLPASRRAAS